MQRSLVVMIAILFGAVLPAANPAWAQNQMENGGFEQPAITDGGNDGSETGLWYTDEVYLVKSAIYSISAWVKTEGDATGAVMFGPSGNISFGQTPEWTQLQRTFSATATGWERLHVQGFGKGTVYFDDVSIQMIYGPWVGGSGTIVTDGAPLVGIVLPDSSNMAEVSLGLEVRRVLKAMTGTDLPILKKSKVVPDSNRRIYIGRAADTASYTTDLATVGDEGIILDITPQAVACLGNTPRGTYYAVQELFYKLGCRWYTPWDGGEVIPSSTSLSLPTGKIVHAPSFKLRGSKVIQGYIYPPAMTPGWFDTQAWVDWAARNRMNGLAVGSMEQFMSYGQVRGFDAQELNGHTVQYILLAGGRTLAKYPLYYPLVDGVRVDTTPWRTTSPSNICVSNEDVINFFADFANEYFDKYPYAGRMMIGQSDVGAWCECANCMALDPPGLVDWSKKRDFVLYGLTDRWMWFINRVAEKVENRHPGKFIATFAYADTVNPPVEAKNNPRSNVMVEETWSFAVNYPTPYGDWDSCRCFKHSLEDATCPSNVLGMEMFNLWSELAPVCIYSYYRNYNTGYLPESYCHKDADFYRALHARGVRNVSDEWGTDVLAAPLLLNLRMRLLWDVNTDVDQYIDDFCTKVYGPSASSVKQYFEEIEQVVSGSANAHVIFGENLLTLTKCTELESYLSAAQTAAGSDTILLGRIARLRIAVYYTRIILNDPNSVAVKSAANSLIQTYNIPIQAGKYVF